jgi:hypothetical protein
MLSWQVFTKIYEKSADITVELERALNTNVPPVDVTLVILPFNLIKLFMFSIEKPINEAEYA